jgi:hypothetical protein
VLVSLSSGGKYLRGWSMKDGELLWETTLYTAAAPSADAAAERTKDRGIDLLLLGEDVDGDGAEDVLVLARGEVQLRSLADGGAAWVSEAAEAFEKETVRLRALARFGLGDDAAFVAFGATAGDGAPAAVLIDRRTGATSRAAVSSGADVDVDPLDAESTRLGSFATKSTASGAHVAGLADDGKKLFVADLAMVLAGKRGAVTTHPVPEGLGGAVTMLPTRGSDAASDVAARDAGAAVVRGDAGSALLTVDETAKKTADKIKTLGVFGPGAAVSQAIKGNSVRGASVLVAAGSTLESVSLSVVSSDGAEAASGSSSRAEFPSGERSSHGEVKRVFAADFGALAVRADASLSMTPPSDGSGAVASIAWRREEALALATESMFARLPPPKSAAAAAADDARVRPSFEERVRAQTLSAKARFKRATAAEMAELTALRRARGNKLLPTRDGNGFRRQIVLLSPDGVLASLHNGDGRTLWRTFLGATGPGFRYSAMYAWTLAPGDVDAEHALVLGTQDSSEKGASAATRAVVVDLHAGAIVRDDVLPFAVAHVLPLPSEHSSHHHHHHHEHPSAALLVDARSERATVFPATEAARTAAYVNRAEVFFYTVDQSRAEVRGYSLLPAPLGSDAFDAAQSWSVKFPPEVGAIVGYAAKPPDETVHTWTRVLGDRSTLFKYLSPNVIFVAAAQTGAAHGAGSEGGAASAVSVHLIDAATGRVLYRVRHPEARGPVHAVVCENWVAYHYFNLKAGRHAMSVLEMFDDAEHRKGAGVGDLMAASLMGRNETETVSSLAPPPLRIMGQSYFIRPSATMLKATYSEKGVTAHQILMGTGTDQIAALDKRWLDPRRPTKPTPHDRDEGLIPYAEVLPIFANSWVTTKHQVRRLRKIATAAASLESTVLCFAHGLDLFYTRLHPSRSYDMLDDEFSYLLLIVTLAALAAGALVTQGLSVVKDLDRKWR